MSHRLILHTKVYWPDAVSDGCIRTLMIDDVFVVYQAVGGLMIIIAGMDETDEMILADVMNCLVQVMSETLGEGHNENSIVDTENFTKLSICIDEMVPEVSSSTWVLTVQDNLTMLNNPFKMPVKIISTLNWYRFFLQGIIECLTPEIVLKQSKLKNL